MSRNPAAAFANRWSRRLHRGGAIVAAVPLLIIITTGLLLQLKKEWSWVQPPTLRGTGQAPVIGFDRILEIARTIPAAGVRDWSDIDRLDVQPGRGLVKVHPRNRVEIQIDTGTGAVLQVMHRRSDLVESLHDGSWFHDRAKLWVFLPTGAALLLLWFSGVYLWLLPHWARRARDKRTGAR
ncbi:MAG: PepSY domain-containing protein [Phycisphaerales bacterium]